MTRLNRAGESVRVPVRCPKCSLFRAVRLDSLRRMKKSGRVVLCPQCTTPGPKPGAIRREPRPVATTPLACGHCGKSKVNRPRGLCWHCYYTPGVKDMHPSTSKYARRGYAAPRGPAPLPEPTGAMPGTPEKVAVMESRAAAGQALFHPLDGLRVRN